MLGGELRQALRSLSRAPAYAAVCLATFALVTGAAAGIFGAADAVLLQSLPYPESESLVFLGESSEVNGRDAGVTSALTLNTVAQNSETLEDVAIFNIMQAVVTEGGDPVQYAGAAVTWNYFRALRRSASIGRTFEEGDGLPNGPALVVISDALWRQRFQADPAIVGRSINLSGNPHEVIGVMPADFRSPDDYIFGARPSDIWRAVTYTGQQPGSRYLRGVARIKAGVTAVQVTAELDAIRTRLGEQFREWAASNRIVALPLQQHITREARPVLMLLFATAILVLFVGCANLANMVLTRGLGRVREAGVRVALGARRSAAVRPLLLETLLLGLMGAAAGLLIATFALDVLIRAAPEDLPRLDAIGIDMRVVSIAFVLALAVAALASLFPALRLRPDGEDAVLLVGRMRGGTAARGHHRAQAAFAVTQLAFALAVLSGAALLARSFFRLNRVDPGFRAERLYAAQIDLPASRYPDGAAMVRLTEQVAASLQTSREIEAVSFVTTLPQHGLNNFSVATPVLARPADAEPAWAHYRGVTPGYFDAMGIPLRRGRSFQTADHGGRPRAALVNEEYARRFFPNGDALGQLVVASDDTVEIAGVVGNVKYSWPGAPDVPEMYVPYRGEMSTVFLVARARGNREAASAAIRSSVHAADPLVPVNVLSSERLLSQSTAQQRFAMLLVSILAAIAVTLAAVGLYGVIAYAVSERTREFAIRVALGLPAPEIVGLVVRRGARIAVAGVVIGLILAQSSGRLLQSLLFGVTTRDPITLAVCITLLVALALFASWWPARRAARVDPALALRNE